MQLGPVWVKLGEAFLEFVGRKVAMYIGLVTPPIAGMCGDAFTKFFFDCWLEGVVSRQRQTRKGEARGVEASVKR